MKRYRDGVTRDPDRLVRPLFAEFLGTALLLFVVVGSGIAAVRLGGAGTAILAVHAVSVGLALGAIIAMFISVSGAHFNPTVTLSMWQLGAIERSVAGRYVAAQLLGAGAGTILANASFGLDLVALSETHRRGFPILISEFVATFGLVLIILALVKTGRTTAIPAAVGAWVTGVIIATASTGFANPAVTLARMLTDSYTGIAPVDTPAFVLSQLLGGLAAALCANLLFDRTLVDA